MLEAVRAENQSFHCRHKWRESYFCAFLIGRLLLQCLSQDDSDKMEPLGGIRGFKSFCLFVYFSHLRCLKIFLMHGKLSICFTLKLRCENMAFRFVCSGRVLFIVIAFDGG